LAETGKPAVAEGPRSEQLLSSYPASSTSNVVLSALVRWYKKPVNANIAATPIVTTVLLRISISLISTLSTSLSRKDEALLLRTDLRIEKSSYDRNENNAAEQKVGGIGLPASIVAGSTSAAI
jgi:hypothetical protein